MIAKLPPKRKDGKSSFKQLLDYCMTVEPERTLYVGSQNVISPDTASLEMEALASENTRCTDPVFHFVLSWRELELPTKEQVDEAVQIALKELDLQGCQAVWALQADTENRHVHIAVNRIDPETTKAIQPAGNWTKKALERAARKIELAQGWEIEPSGRYIVTADGELKEKSLGLGEEVKISQTARDIEAHTAIKSVERIGQETAAPLIRSARSWQELHSKLAEQGMSFEQKGSGAVLQIGGTPVKASKIGRDMSLSKLVARLGDYKERSASAEIRNTFRNPEPIERVMKEEKVLNHWELYQKARTEYFGSKKESLAALRQRQNQERNILKKEQKTERTAVFEGTNWKGRGAFLNRQRSVLAAVQQSEKLNLRDRQQQEQEELKKRFPQRFPSFKSWLIEQENPELAVAYRYTTQPVFFSLSVEGSGESRAEDLRAYTPVVGNRGGVAYCRKGGGKGTNADFVDYGKKILLSKHCDATTILAALQLANQKWGSVKIQGTEEYKKQCVEIAIQNNLKIANPELAAAVEEGRKRMFEETKKRWEVKQEPKQESQIEEKKQLFERYAEAVGAEKFRVLVTEFTPEGVQAFVFDRKNGGLDGKTKDELLEAMGKLESYAKYNKNINVVPISPDKHHILIDDVIVEGLEQLKEDGYRPSCVIESSPNNFQAILTVPSLEGDREKDREAANKLTKDLNVRYGDPKLSGAVHAHRLPPFGNFKPKHRREDGTYPRTHLVEAQGGMCGKAAINLKAAQEWLKEQEQKLLREQEHRQRSASVMTGLSGNARDPKGAYWAHYRDIVEKQKGKMDYSRIDSMIGIRMRVTGYSSGQIQAAIEENAPMMRKETMSAQEYDAKYRYRDWKRFARETMEKFVFGTRGAAQYGKAEPYRSLYMKLEGRNLAAEQKQERDKQQERKCGKDNDLGM